MKLFYSARQLPAVISLIGGSLLLASATHAQDSKPILPTNTAVRVEPAAPIRVILPSLWEAKAVARGSEPMAADRHQRQ